MAEDGYMQQAVDFVKDEVLRRLSGDDDKDDDPYAALKGDVFGGADSPEVWQIVVTALLILTFGSLAAGAGVGGGGLFVPIYAILLGVGGKPAVPLSKCTILGAALGNYVTIGWARHPKADRPLIDYEVSTLMQAGELLGVTVGVLLNLLLPELVIMIFLAVLLSFNSYKTLKKGRAKYRAETAAFAKEAQNELGSSAGEFELTAASDPTHAELHRQHAEHVRALEGATRDLRTFLDGEDLIGFAAKLHEYGIETLSDLADEHLVTDSVLTQEVGLDATQVARLHLALRRRVADDALALTPDMNALNFSEADDVRSPKEETKDATPVTAVANGAGSGAAGAEGGTSENKDATRSPELQTLYADAAVQFPRWAYAAVIAMTAFTVLYALIKKDVLTPCYGKGAYWTWMFVAVPVLGVCMALIAVYLNRVHEERVRLGYAYLPADIQFTTEQLWKFPVTAVNAGLAAGLLGIGGGMVIGPLFIEIGMEPQVGTSSCAYMILWTAASGVVQYYYAGKLGWQFMCFFAALGFISGQIGQRGVGAVLKKSGRPSVVVLLLGSIIGLACVVMTISTAVNVASSDSSGGELFALETEWATCGYSKDH